MSWVQCDVCTTCFDDYDSLSYTCFLCEAIACAACGESWERVHPKYQKRACDDCSEVQVSSKEVFDELLTRYRLVKDADPSITYESLREYLKSSKKSRLQVWKEQQGKT